MQTALLPPTCPLPERKMSEALFVCIGSNLSDGVSWPALATMRLAKNQF